jgi:hypothetical protein
MERNNLGLSSWLGRKVREMAREGMAGLNKLTNKGTSNIEILYFLLRLT